MNGIVDPAQKGQYAQSISSIADSLGLPSWFIDLRHAGTHDALPTLPLLRSGCLQVGLSVALRILIKLGAGLAECELLDGTKELHTRESTGMSVARQGIQGSP